jgi:superfamily I DNA and RNA helicase
MRGENFVAHLMASVAHWLHITGLDDAMKLAEEKFNIITKEEWSLRCNNARQCKQNYLRLEPIIDDISEQIVISLQNDSDNSSYSSSEEEEEEVAEEDDGELSEVEAL